MLKFSYGLLAATLGLCLTAGAASAQQVRISYQSLNLADPHDAAVFDHRVQAAARRFCDAAVEAPLDLSANHACRTAVREEVQAKLPSAERLAWAQGAWAQGGRPSVAIASVDR